MRTKAGRLMLSTTTTMSYFGLNTRVYSEEISRLNGPSYKTTLKIMKGETNNVRAHTKEALEKAIDRFELEKIPEILRSVGEKEIDEKQENEAAKMAITLLRLTEKSEEPYILQQIEKHCKNKIDTATINKPESKKVLYNLCIWHGIEYFLHYPHDTGMLVDLAPREVDGKTTLPLRLWANQHVLASKKLIISSRAKSLSQLTTELGITKQAINRYISAESSDHLPRFRTMVCWSELLEDSSGRLELTMISTRSLFIARFLHNYYIDILENTSLSKREILEIFGLSQELRALWPSALFC